MTAGPPATSRSPNSPRPSHTIDVGFPLSTCRESIWITSFSAALIVNTSNTASNWRGARYGVLWRLPVLLDRRRNIGQERPKATEVKLLGVRPNYSVGEYFLAVMFIGIEAGAI